MELIVYSYPPCGTCRKAKKFLQEHGIPFAERHIIHEPPSPEELKKLIEKESASHKEIF